MKGEYHKKNCLLAWKINKKVFDYFGYQANIVSVRKIPDIVEALFNLNVNLSNQVYVCSCLDVAKCCSKKKKKISVLYLFECIRLSFVWGLVNTYFYKNTIFLTGLNPRLRYFSYILLRYIYFFQNER